MNAMVGNRMIRHRPCIRTHPTASREGSIPGDNLAKQSLMQVAARLAGV